MFPRFISPHVLEALADTPVVMIHGARQTGKSTLIHMLTERDYPAQYYTLDDLSLLSVLKKDPVGFLAGLTGPVAIDEVQRVPDLLLAIKAAVDRDRRSGRFLLTGSAHVLQLPNLASVKFQIEFYTKEDFQ